ncbi:MAG: ABC transporter permease subunit [Planctomycetes bacterium]|nr:ABC transporter permease subunit [Planctomycetota bacterium]
MQHQPIQWSHVSILARTHARYSVRGGSGLIYLLAYLMVGLSIAGVMFDSLKTQLDLAKKQGAVKIEDKQAIKAIAQFARPVIAWWVDADEEKGKDPFVEHLVVERPPLLSAYLLILMAFIPFTSCLASFNQLSGDIGTKGLRYLLLRTERINILVARFLGTLLFTAVISAAVMLLVVIYLAIQFDANSFGELLSWGLVGWFAIIAFSLPYLLLGTWLSAVFDTPIATLVLCILATGFPIIFLKVAKVTLPNNDNDWLDRLTPWGWKYEILHPDWGHILLALLVMLGFSLAAGILAYRHFLKRDL